MGDTIRELKDGEALYSQQKQDQELTVAQIMNSLLPNSDWNWRNGRDLTEVEDIKRWQEYTEELYKKDLHDQDNHDGVITHTHLELDILECEVK